MEKLQRVHADISKHLEAIAQLFTQRPPITIIIRTPWLADGGILLSDDDLEQAVAEIQRLAVKPIITGVNP